MRGDYKTDFCNPVRPEKGICNGLCKRSKGFDEHQDEIHREFHEKAMYMFRTRCVGGLPRLFYRKGGNWYAPAFYVLIALMAPFFLFGIVEKDGLPLEEYLLNFIRHVFVYPQIRICETESIYGYYDERRKKEIKEQTGEALSGKKGGKRKDGNSSIKKQSGKRKA